MQTKRYSIASLGLLGGAAMWLTFGASAQTKPEPGIPPTLSPAEAQQHQRMLDEQAERSRKADALIRDQEAQNRRSENLLAKLEAHFAKQEKLTENQTRALARYEKLLDTMETQQRQYQRYLDSLPRK